MPISKNFLEEMTTITGSLAATCSLLNQAKVSDDFKEEIISRLVKTTTIFLALITANPNSREEALEQTQEQLKQIQREWSYE